jgi:beta-RFAP synthase
LKRAVKPSLRGDIVVHPSSTFGSGIEIEFFSRLHFGLMEICPGQPHCYGGVGLMVDVPAPRLAAAFGESESSQILINAEEYWAQRARETLATWAASREQTALPVREIRVLNAPSAHVGLGSGTQFACGIAALLQIASGLQSKASPGDVTTLGDMQAWFPDASTLSRATGRGRRSFIGLQGFLQGGLVVDAGMLPSATGDAVLSERTMTIAFPETWRMLLWCVDSQPGESGEDEVAMIARCAQQPNPRRSAMLACIHEQLLPAIAANDWSAAGQAIGRYGAWAGEIFRPIQGGIYRSSTIARSVAAIEGLGIPGVGQSSWGPTVYALTRDEEHACWLENRLREQWGDSGRIHIAKVARAARVHALGSAGSSGAD